MLPGPYLLLSTKDKFLPIASHDLSDHKSTHHPDHSLARNSAELHEAVRFSSSFFRERVCLEVLSDTRLGKLKRVYLKISGFININKKEIKINKHSHFGLWSGVCVLPQIMPPSCRHFRGLKHVNRW